MTKNISIFFFFLPCVLLQVELVSTGGCSPPPSWNQAVFLGGGFIIPLSWDYEHVFPGFYPKYTSHISELTMHYFAVSSCKLQPCLRPVIKIRNNIKHDERTCLRLCMEKRARNLQNRLERWSQPWLSSSELLRHGLGAWSVCAT